MAYYVPSFPFTFKRIQMRVCLICERPALQISKKENLLQPGLPEPPWAALFGWSRSRFLGPAPAPTPIYILDSTVNILFLRDPKYDFKYDYDYDYNYNYKYDYDYKYDYKYDYDYG